MNRRVAILGCGKIGESLLGGLLSAEWRAPDEVVATAAARSAPASCAAATGSSDHAANPEAVDGAGLVVLAVKPQDFETLLAEIGPLLTPEQTVLSVAAAVTTARIEAGIPAGVPVVRSMPNAPAIVHEGIAGICAGAHAGDEHLALAEECLTHLGGSSASPSRTWTRSRPSPARAPRTSRCSPRR